MHTILVFCYALQSYINLPLELLAISHLQNQSLNGWEQYLSECPRSYGFSITVSQVFF